MSAKLNEYGWDSSWAEAFEPHAAAGLEAGRVVVQERGRLLVRTENQVVEAVTAGALRHRARCADELPAVGDWVALDGSSSAVERRVRAILPRRSKLSRKVAGTVTAEQLVAANVDVVLVVMGLDGDYSVRRLERFLVMAWESGARPLVVLNKVDRCDDWVERCEEVGGVAPGVAVVAMSALEGRLDDLLEQLKAGETAALIGSSGVGKSTLINRLCGEQRLATMAVRKGDDRGRHTTTHRQLVRLPGGSLVIDNPGVREVQLWIADEGLDDAFDDVRRLALDCRFRDCRHEGEPGCAVVAAIERGELAAGRLASHQALEREARALERRRDAQARRAEDRRLGRLYRSVQAEKRRRLDGSG